MNQSLLARLAVGLVAVTVVFSVVGWLVYEFAFKGTVVVEGEFSQISITKLTGETVVEGKKASTRLAPGEYNVAVESEKSATAKLVTVQPFSTTKISAGNTSLLSANLAVRTPFYGVMASNESIVGFDPTTEGIKEVKSASGITTKLSGDNTDSVSDFTPAMAGTAVNYETYKQGAIVTTANKFYSLSNTTGPHALLVDAMELSNKVAPRIVVATNPQKESFVIAVDRDIYLYDNAQSQPKKVYAAKKKFDQLAYGENKIIIYSTELPDAIQNIEGSYSDYQNDPLVVDLNSKKEKSLPGPVSDITVSPDGKLATVKPRREQPYLYDTVAEKTVRNIAQTSVASPYWLTDTSFVYPMKNALWQYNTEQISSVRIAKLQGAATSINEDGIGGYYITAYGGAELANVYHINSVPVSANIQKLQFVAPFTNADYAISFLNIDKPTVVIETKAIINRPDQLEGFRQDTIAFRKNALDYLTSKGIDLSEVRITYSPADPL